MAFKMIEGLFAIVALVQCFAGGASELAQQLGVGGLALRTNYRSSFYRRMRWWRNSVSG